MLCLSQLSLEIELCLLLLAQTLVQSNLPKAQTWRLLIYFPTIPGKSLMHGPRRSIRNCKIWCQCHLMNKMKKGCSYEDTTKHFPHNGYLWYYLTNSGLSHEKMKYFHTIFISTNPIPNIWQIHEYYEATFFPVMKC